MTTLSTATTRAPERLGAPAGARRTSWRLLLMLLAPALALYALFVIAPLAQAAYYSLYSWNGLGPLDDFVGGQNYARLLQDDLLRRALLNNIAVIAVSLAVQLPLALWVATMLTGKFRGRAVFRVAFFLPYIVSEVVAAVLWNAVFLPDAGVLNSLLRAVGADALAHPWLGDPATVMPAVLVVVTWKFFGFYTVLFLAALQGVPSEHVEAAQIDGANRRQVFWHITMPAIGPTVRICAFLSVIGSLQLFDLVWVLTGGGPVGASATMVTTMVSTGLRSYEFGYASAIAVVVALVAFVFALAYQKLVLARDAADDAAPGSTK